jgi:hypothetical protein
VLKIKSVNLYLDKRIDGSKECRRPWKIYVEKCRLTEEATQDRNGEDVLEYLKEVGRINSKTLYLPLRSQKEKQHMKMHFTNSSWEYEEIVILFTKIL